MPAKFCTPPVNSGLAAAEQSAPLNHALFPGEHPGYGSGLRTYALENPLCLCCTAKYLSRLGGGGPKLQKVTIITINDFSPIT
jgi:hypothetical protein